MINASNVLQLYAQFVEFTEEVKRRVPHTLVEAPGGTMHRINIDMKTLVATYEGGGWTTSRSIDLVALFSDAADGSPAPLSLVKV